MRDLSQIEREFREYERKIQRLKQLERELISLDTKGFENEVRSIRSKIKDPNSVNQVEREISELKQKIEARERRRKEAVKVIDDAKTAIQKAKGLNLPTKDAERLLNEAKSLLSKGDYATAIERANRSKRTAEAEMDKRFKHLREEALNAIGSAQSTLQNAKKLSINTKSEEEKLNNAKLKLDEKDFSKATKLANECRDSLNLKIRDYKQAAERSAKQFLEFAYSKIKEAEKLGINVSDAKDLHKKAILEFDNREYEKAIEYSEKCKKTAEDEISRYNYAKEQIRTSKDIVKSIKKLTPIPKAEELIEKAESALKVGNYNSAVKFAKEAEGEALRVKKDYETYKEASEFISSIESEISRIKGSGVKITKSNELIEQAKSELNKNNFEIAKELANKAKKTATERKSEYESAFKSISEAERILNETKNKGVIISSDLLTKSKQAFDDGDYEESVRLAEKLKNLVNNTEIKYREARDWIKSAESAIGKAKEFGCDTSEAEELLNRARAGFEDGNYAQTISDARKSEEIAKETKAEAKPEIEVDLSKKEFQRGVWEKVLLKVRNKGNANAKNIKIEFKRAEIEGLELIKSLGAGEKRDLTIDFKSKDAGRVPLRIDIHYEDFDGKRYEEPKTVYINVGEVKEKPETPVEAEFRRLAVGTALDKIITSAEYQMLLEEAERLKIPRERADALIQGIASEYGATIEARVGAPGIEIKRGYEILSNKDLRFGIRIINNTGYMIADVETILDYPRTLFSMKGNVVQSLGNIHPNGERTAKYTLTPLGCIHNEKIDAIVVYKDHIGTKHTVQMRPKEVHCVCPFLREKEMREGEFAELANACEYIQEGLSFSGIGVNEIVALVKEAYAHRLYVVGEHEVDTAKIVDFAGESIGEKAYYLLTAVVQPFKNLTQVALRAYSDKPYGLHGFLNEFANSIRHLVGSVQSAKEIGVIESKQVVNIIDSVVQRTSFGGIGEGTGATSVTIEGSVVQRTEIGSVRIRRCPNCGKEVQGDEKFCTECGARLE